MIYISACGVEFSLDFAGKLTASTLIRGPVCELIAPDLKTLPSTTTPLTTPFIQGQLVEPPSDNCLEEIYGPLGIEITSPWCYVVLALVLVLLLCFCCLVAGIYRRTKHQAPLLNVFPPPRLHAPTLIPSVSSALEPEMMMRVENSDGEEEQDVIILYTTDGSRPRVP